MSEVPKVIEVALALIWRDGHVLLSRRRSDAHLGGYWEFPGGKIQAGETPEQCAVREAEEEVGVRCAATGVRPVIEWSYPQRCVRLHPVDCRYTGGEPEALQVTEVAWATPSELEAYQFPPANESLVAALRDEGAPGTIQE